MLPYRFEFETDEQYEARTGISLKEVQSTESSGNTNSVVIQPPSDHQSTSFFVFPWWTILLALLVLIIGAYEFHRRRVTQALRQLNTLPENEQDTLQHPFEPIPPPTDVQDISPIGQFSNETNEPPTPSGLSNGRSEHTHIEPKSEADDQQSSEPSFERRSLPEQIISSDRIPSPAASAVLIDRSASLTRTKRTTGSRRLRIHRSGTTKKPAIRRSGRRSA